jgi:hypothetical protein
MKAVFLAMILLAAGLTQAAAQPRVRVEIAAKPPLLVGQQIRANVTVLVPNYFLSPPQFPAFDVPGAVVTLLDENALNSSEMIGGETYAGIRKSYLITPQQAGDFALPPAQITFRYAAEPGKPAVDGAVTLPPSPLMVQLPAGAQGAAAPALVAKVVVTQSLDRDLKDVKVGDALTRTVETFAANTQAMMIPPPTFAASVGVRLYPRDPVLTDVTTDHGGFLGGRRVDRVTYVFEQPGTFTLPAVAIGWFNVESGKQEVATAAAVTVAVAPAVPPGTDLAPPAPQDNSAADDNTHTAWQRAAVRSLGLIAAALLVVWAAWRFGPPLRAELQARGRARQASEPAAFARLKQACRAGDAGAAYRELGVWARCQGFHNVQILCERQSALRMQADALARRLYGAASQPAAWNGSELLKSATIVRATLHANAHYKRRRLSALPALNPQIGTLYRFACLRSRCSGAPTS